MNKMNFRTFSVRLDDRMNPHFI